MTGHPTAWQSCDYVGDVALIEADVDALFRGASAAVITTTRRDGSALTSPVWVRRVGDRVELVMAASDGKVANLQREPQCCLVVFESLPPFRAIEVRGHAKVERRDDVTEVRREIARRYLGAQAGDAFTDGRTSLESVVVSLPLSAARSWDLRAILD